MVIHFNPTQNVIRIDGDWPDIGEDLQPPEYTQPVDYLRYPPIVDAKVSHLSSRGTGMKPEWISAKIRQNHLDTGEPTSTNPRLRDEIRNRGVREDPRDDCGHLIARCLGGKMVEFNLFPQELAVNRGRRVNIEGTEYPLSKWWKNIEAVIYVFLKCTHPRYRPRVYFQIRLQYGDSEFPDRPVGMYYIVKFKTDDDSSDDELNDEEQERQYRCLSDKYCRYVYNYIRVDGEEPVIGLDCFSESEASSEVYERIAMHILKYLLELPDIVGSTNEIEPRIPSSFVTRQTSFLDVVPIVGDIRDIRYGTGDIINGNIGSGILNIAIGVGCLALTILSIGALSSVTKGAAKESVKWATKTGAKEVVKEGAKEGSKFLAKEVAKQAIKEANRLIAKMVAASLDQHFMR